MGNSCSSSSGLGATEAYAPHETETQPAGELETRGHRSSFVKAAELTDVQQKNVKLDHVQRLLDKLLQGEQVTLEEVKATREALDVSLPPNLVDHFSSTTDWEKEDIHAVVSYFEETDYSSIGSRTRTSLEVQNHFLAYTTFDSSGRHCLKYSKSFSGHHEARCAVQDIQESDQVFWLLQHTKVAPTISSRLEGLLQDAETLWDLDTYELEKETSGQPLSCLTYYLLERSGLIRSLNLDTVKLATFLRHIEKGYADHPYHNRMHAAAVVHTLHTILTKGGVGEFLDPTSLLACYLAAAIHDVQHKGVNNDFLVKSQDPLAVLYNDKAPLENHHLATAFKALRIPEANFLQSWQSSEWFILRGKLIQLVLATDMKAHFSIIAQFQASFGISKRASDTCGVWAVPLSLGLEEADVLQQLALKCADIGHTAMSLNFHKKWTNNLQTEFFRQGDLEAAAFLKVAPFMDRTKITETSLAKTQVGFLEVIARPLFVNLERVAPNCGPLCEKLNENLSLWKTECES